MRSGSDIESQFLISRRKVSTTIRGYLHHARGHLTGDEPSKIGPNSLNDYRANIYYLVFRSQFSALHTHCRLAIWYLRSAIMPFAALQLKSTKTIIFALLICFYSDAALSQQHSYDPNTDNDGGQQFGDCLKDINRFCKAWEPLLFELENCLQSHIESLTPACRSHMTNTDFRTYHRDEPQL